MANNVVEVWYTSLFFYVFFCCNAPVNLNHPLICDLGLAPFGWFISIYVPFYTGISFLLYTFVIYAHFFRNTTRVFNKGWV
jgi:hypothetical protein